MKDVTRIPLTTSVDTSEMYAEARPMMVFRPTHLWVDGEVIGLHEQEAVTPGQVVRHRLKRDVTEQTRCAFIGQELHTPGDVRETMIPASVHAKTIPGKIPINDGATFIFSVTPETPGRIVGIDISARAFCGTCGGTTLVGRSIHHMRMCPACLGERAFRDKEPGSVFIEEVKTGLAYEIAGGPLPIAALRGVKLRLSLGYPGQMIIVAVRNGYTAPIEVEGSVLFQEEDVPVPTPAPEGGGGGPFATSPGAASVPPEQSKLAN